MPVLSTFSRHGHKIRASQESDYDMRVAYLTNVYPKVSHSFIRREILALERQGVDVTRFAIRGWDSEVVDPEDEAEIERTRYTLQKGLGGLFLKALHVAATHPVRFARALSAALSMGRNGMRPWPYHLIYLAHACQILLWLRQEPQPITHLHAHFGTNPAEIALLVRMLGGPEYSFTVHGMDEVDNAPRLAFDRKIGGAKFAAAISRFNRSQLMRHAPPPLWNRIKVVRCGLPEAAFAEATPIADDNLVFLSIGRLSPEKGHLVLLDAFATVVQAQPDARLVLAGDGELRREITDRIAALGLEGSVRITGWIDAQQVRQELRAARTLVQPSFIEGLPVVIMEALAQNRPVISTYVGGIPELVRPGETGWLVPAGDSDALAAAMLENLQTGAQTLLAMGQSGAALTAAQHDVDGEARRLCGLFFGDDPCAA